MHGEKKKKRKGRERERFICIRVTAKEAWWEEELNRVQSNNRKRDVERVHDSPMHEFTLFARTKVSAAAAAVSLRGGEGGDRREDTYGACVVCWWHEAW